MLIGLWLKNMDLFGVSFEISNPVGIIHVFFTELGVEGSSEKSFTVDAIIVSCEHISSWHEILIFLRISPTFIIFNCPSLIIFALTRGLNHVDVVLHLVVKSGSEQSLAIDVVIVSTEHVSSWHKVLILLWISPTIVIFNCPSLIIFALTLNEGGVVHPQSYIFVVLDSGGLLLLLFLLLFLFLLFLFVLWSLGSLFGLLILLSLFLIGSLLLFTGFLLFFLGLNSLISLGSSLLIVLGLLGLGISGVLFIFLSLVLWKSCGLLFGFWSREFGIIIDVLGVWTHVFL